MPGPKRVFVGCPFTRSRRKSHGRLKTELEAERPCAVSSPNSRSAPYLLTAAYRSITLDLTKGEGGRLAMNPPWKACSEGKSEVESDQERTSASPLGVRHGRDPGFGDPCSPGGRPPRNLSPTCSGERAR